RREFDRSFAAQRCLAFPDLTCSRLQVCDPAGEGRPTSGPARRCRRATGGDTMRVMRFVCAAAIAGTVVLGASTASAQETPQALRQEIDQLRQDFEALKQQYGDRLTALETKLAAAEGTQAAPAPPPPGAPAPEAPPPQQTAQQTAPQPTAQVPPGAEGAGGPSGALPVYGAAAASSKVFNPDIAVIGDFLGAAGHNTVNPSPSMEMHESEAAFQAVVDPYARADFFLSFGEEGV